MFDPQLASTDVVRASDFVLGLTAGGFPPFFPRALGYFQRDRPAAAQGLTTLA